MTIIFSKLSDIFNAMVPESVNKSPRLFYAFDGGFNMGAAKLPRPLDLAIQNDDAEEMLRLLQKGADPNLRTHFSGPALYEAVYKDVAIMETLLHWGADVNAQNMAGATALQKAAGHSDFPSGRAAVAFLLAHGADPLIANDAGDTALAIAKWRGCPEVIAMMQAAATTRQNSARNTKTPRR